MSDSVFPSIRGLAWPVKRIPEMNTLQQRSPGGYSTQVALYQNPIWRWDLKYNYILDDPSNLQMGFTDTDWRTLVGFFLARRGSFDDFLFHDVADDSAADAPLVIVNDGAGTFYSPVQRKIGEFEEDITDLIGGNVMGSIAVKNNGTPTVDFLLGTGGFTTGSQSYDGLYLQWGHDPSPGPITATFSFYFRVQFEKDDSLEFARFVAQPNRYSLDSLPLMTRRPRGLI